MRSHLDQPPQWISALDALTILGGGSPNKQWALPILLRARAGLIQAHADAITLRSQDRWGKRHNEERGAGLVPLWFWQECCEAEAAVQHWRTGDFQGPGFIDGRATTAFLTGVKFDRAGIEELASMTPAQRGETSASNRTRGNAEVADKPSGTNPGGRHVSKEDWNAFWLAAMDMLNDGELNKVNYPTQTALRKALLSKIDDRLSNGSIEPAVQKIWFKFVEGA